MKEDQSSAQSLTATRHMFQTLDGEGHQCAEGKGTQAGK